MSPAPDLAQTFLAGLEGKVAGRSRKYFSPLAVGYSFRWADFFFQFPRLPSGGAGFEEDRAWRISTCPAGHAPAEAG